MTIGLAAILFGAGGIWLLSVLFLWAMIHGANKINKDK